MVMGHEFTHGFDDEGRQFDAKGNLKDWWTPADAKAFDQREQCLVNEYASFDLGGGLHMNGKLTLGENTADNGGLRLAWMAMMSDLAGRTLPKPPAIQASSSFCRSARCGVPIRRKKRPGWRLRPMPIIDRYRVNGTVSNMPEFQKAFGCKGGLPMARAGQACHVW